jgi:hypothetical protein
MRLAPVEFIRRFLLHVLPDGFRRIRYYGFLANGHRQAKLARIRQLLPSRPPQEASTANPSGDATMSEQVPAEAISTDDNASEPACPHCGASMEIVERLPAPHRHRTRRIDTS